METLFMIFAVIVTTWSATFGHMINVDVAVGIIALCFVFTWGMRKGIKEKAEAERQKETTSW
jgi:NADH:ubiquinone oxidoreductase subunit 6 (subunit J)